MQLILYNKDNYSKQFIYNYLPLYIRSIILKSLDKNKLMQLDQEFNIKSEDIIKEALNKLYVSETPDEYIIKINKNKKYKGHSLNYLINLITYGNRNCKGYKLIYDVFDLMAAKIDMIYKEWLDGS